MGSKVTKIEYHPAGFKKVMRQDVLPDLVRRGDAIAEQAGPGVEAQASVGRNRARVTVMTETWEAAESEARNKSLTSAIGAGRG